MKVCSTLLLVAISVVTVAPLFGQGNTNCFLWDFEPKYATIPPYEDVEKTTATPTITVVFNTADTLGKVSKYIFGNALAAWVGNSVLDPVLIGHLQKLSPTLIRYPGGSWADIFFWSENPGDLPNTIPDGTNNGAKIPLYAQYGTNSWPTTIDNYYSMRNQVNGTQGLITINYGYARYGLSAKPAEQAAHYAAEWVRYDGGMAKFWEIGNENAGPWEAGWQIDTTLNRDGQPEIITGELYGKHFKIFADSMRSAAAELDETIYIGGQIFHKDESWNVAYHGWNEAFFREVGGAADFYVFHDYFGNRTSTLKNQIDVARSTINQYITFIRQDIVNNQATSKPIALTEWNLDIDVKDVTQYQRKTSIVNGVQAVVLICEMIKNNFGMAARWLVANGDYDGMFYDGNNSSIPRWNPRPDFYYLYYLQRFTGDHAVSTSFAGSNNDVLAYATLFSSGDVGVVVVNKGTADQVVRLAPADYGVGERFYIYSLIGVDNSQWPQGVFVNDEGPTGQAWGPLDILDEVEARAYPIGHEIKFESPAKSVEYILIEPGEHILSVSETNRSRKVDRFDLHQNYPNPFNPKTTISYALPQTNIITLKVYDVKGREIATLLSKDKIGAGNHEVSFDAANLASGVYFYRLETENSFDTKKMLLLR